MDFIRFKKKNLRKMDRLRLKKKKQFSICDIEHILQNLFLNVKDSLNVVNVMNSSTFNFYL